MKTVTLYTGGGVSLSPVYAEGRRKSAYVRLFADEGKALQKGEVITTCVDVLASAVSDWAEIDYAPSEEPTVEDKAEAYDILMGVTE